MFWASIEAGNTKVYQTRMQKHMSTAQQIFKRNNNNKGPIRNICNAA
jgi:hypothetical protein